MKEVDNTTIWTRRSEVNSVTARYEAMIADCAVCGPNADLFMQRISVPEVAVGRVFFLGCPTCHQEMAHHTEAPRPGGAISLWNYLQAMMHVTYDDYRAIIDGGALSG